MANTYESWTDEKLEEARIESTEVANGAAELKFPAMERMHRGIVDRIADEQASRAHKRGES